MSDPAAYFGLGIELRIGDGAGPEVFTVIPGCRSFTGPGKTRDTVDVTAHDAPNGYRQFISGLRDGGEVTFDLNWLFDDPAQQALEDSFDSDDTTNFQMAFPQAASDNLLTFAAFVTDMGWAGPVDDAVTRSVTLKVTGPITVGTDS